MNKADIEKRLERYREGRCTPEELAMLEGQIFNAVGKPELAEQELSEIKNEIRAGLKTLVTTSIQPAKHRPLWPKIVAVAAAIAVMTLGTWLYTSSFMRNVTLNLFQGPGLATTNDIAPGRNTATLTFDNGEVVSLNEEELSISSESGSRRGDPKASSEKTQFLASRIARSETVVLSTPRGGTYKVVLPDGSRVWLNADSKISFPSQFDGRERKVLLVSGEAYFEVAKSYVIRSLSKSEKRQVRLPFLVESDGQKVEVLGTHFNISAYKDEKSTKTTLLEGSVNVNGKILIPNQQAVLSASSATIQVKQVNPSEAVAWKEGYFSFEKTPLEEVMRQVARWYDVEVVYENPELKAQLMGGSVSRYDKVSRILKTLENTGAVKFRLEGRTVYVGK